MNNYCTFYLVRHGQTDWNVQGILQGQKDSYLTKEGIRQAQESAKKLSHVHFDAVFSSDLIRTKRTAEIITAEKKLAVFTTKLLRERTFGPYEGMKAMDYFLKYEKALQELQIVSEKQRLLYKPHPQVESEEEVLQRALTFIREVAVGYPGKKVLLVSHGGLIRVFLLHLGYIKRSKFQAGRVKNLALVKFLCDGSEFIIKEVEGVESTR